MPSTPATPPAFGSTITAEGVQFRVWAPNAESVAVVGDFNGWDAEAHPMERAEDGTWSAAVAGAEAGQEYQYALTREGASFMRADPHARQMTNSVGNSVVYDPGAFDWEGDEAKCPPWNELVIYELHVGTFGESPPDRPATLYEAADRLEYLQMLGVNCVEVMPLAEFAGDLSWGYNPAHPFAVESAYGGPDGLKAFVKAAHARGIAVILDVVYNHFGPSDLALWQFDGWSENGKGGIYFYNDDRSSTPWGDTRPNYGRPEVRQYICDNAAMWLGEFHIDGLRLDMTPHIYRAQHNGQDIPEGWQTMQEVNAMVNERFPGRLTIAEDLHTNYAITAPIGNGGAGFGAQWDADFVHPVRAALITPTDEGRDLGAVVAALEHRYEDDAFSRVIYTESHDEVANGQARVAEEIYPGDADSWASKKRATLGAALVLTAPGIPMLFQGQALLEDGYFQDTDALDWSKAERHRGLVGLHRDLIALRRDFDGATSGLKGHQVGITYVDDAADVIAYHRFGEGGVGDSVFVVLNLSAHAHDALSVPLPHAGTWTLRFNSDWSGYDPEFGDHPAHDLSGETATVSIGPYTALIYAQTA